MADPYTADELAELRESAAGGHTPIRARWLATVDAERARADQADTRLAALISAFWTWDAKWLCHMPSTAPARQDFVAVIRAATEDGE